MTTAALPRKAGPYQGNGVTTVFSYGFQVFAPGDIQVVKASSLGVETTLIESVDYSVVVNADQTNLPGGSITLLGGALAVGEALAVVGNLAYSQTTQLPNGGAYNATTVERMVDRVTRLVQQLLEVANRGVQLAITAASNVSSRLPAPTPGSVIGWNASATAMQNYDPAGLGVAVSYAQWATQTFNGTGAQTAFVLTVDAGVASNIDLTLSGITQAPGINYSYDQASKTITFLTGAPPAGTNNVVARYGQGLPAGTLAAVSITDSTAAGRAVLTAANAAAQRTALGLAIGADVQAFNANNAVLNAAQVFTAAQRGTVTTDNDLSFDMAVTNNFRCTPSAGGTLTFANITGGQSGFILLVNGSNYAIAAAATTKVGASTLATISATGTYLLSYMSDGTNVFVVSSGALA